MKTDQIALISFTLIFSIILPGFLDKDLCMQDGRIETPACLMQDYLIS
jgi:hypothetical protein